CARRAENFDSW
nr:immunoglobulin heavy chain junction region [Macaca mulatta]MOY22009.1 immunoglobulin heavy chain junction region [Macaca mulatta]MOY22117.1 immunoglobulin heavy chain junction region [Macaca mulatta]MOY23131.1 immunoglobulin heavy chain junction region [Macaca mulatta]MOY23714.1 immunoglobulin heavy chain junction region [Macaca mulatta]